MLVMGRRLLSRRTIVEEQEVEEEEPEDTLSLQQSHTIHSRDLGNKDTPRVVWEM